MKYKVVYIDRNFIVGRDYKYGQSEGDGFFTLGFGGAHSRQFKKYNPDIEVECWKADSRIKKIYEKNISGVKFMVFPARYISNLGHYSISLKKKIKQEIGLGEKIIFNLSSCKHLLFYQLSSEFKNVPFVIQAHGETTARFDLNVRKGLLRKIKAFIEIPVENIAFRYVDNYFALDERIGKWLPRHSEKKSLLMTIGVNEEMFPVIERSEARKQLNLNENKKYILYVGILAYHKRVDLLIDAYNEIKPMFPDIELLIAGNFSNDILYPAAKEAGAVICGRVLNTEMYKYLTAADCYVLPDLLPIHTFGGIGELPVQSLLCNTPILGGTVRNIPEQVRNKVGIFTQTKEELVSALIAVINSKMNFTEMRKTAIDYFSWGNVSLKTRIQYNRLVNLYWGNGNMRSLKTDSEK
jgi:glycosyltransferase involved in cell wall biosynthesis